MTLRHSLSAGMTALTYIVAGVIIETDVIYCIVIPFLNFFLYKKAFFMYEVQFKQIDRI